MDIIKENISILVVDDEEMIVTILLNYLGEKGYQVTGLTDPAEAIELIRSTTFDVVFTDLMMPVINGMELVKEISQQDNDTQIIIFTGYASVESAIEAVQQGVYDYIKKPFRLEDIETILGHALEKLLLKRENLALHGKIEGMLSQITMLYDISNIIYQVRDKKYAMEMLFDTLTESMGIQTAMMCEQSSEGSEFSVSYCARSARSHSELFDFYAKSVFNGNPLSTDEPTILEQVGKELYLEDEVISLPKPCRRLTFIPIKYQGELKGYLLIFEHQDHSYPFKDELTLLKILATQIAPIMGLSVSSPIDVVAKGRNEPARAMNNLIQAELDLSDASDSPVSLAMTRLVASGSSDDDSEFALIREAWRNMIANQLGPEKRLHWAGIDTLLVLASGGNPIGLEHHLANVRDEVESSKLGSKSKVKLSMAYSILTYPFDADNAKKMANNLSSRLFYSASEIKFNQ